MGTSTHGIEPPPNQMPGRAVTTTSSTKDTMTWGVSPHAAICAQSTIPASGIPMSQKGLCRTDQRTAHNTIQELQTERRSLLTRQLVTEPVSPMCIWPEISGYC